MKAETANVDATINVRTEALAKAESEGDTNKANTLKASIADIQSKADAQAKRAAKAAASQVLEDMRTKTAKEIVEAAKPKAEVPTKHVKSATQTLYDLIAQWERTCLDTDTRFERSKDASARAKEAAVTALLALSERAKNRAEEIGGK